MMHLFSFTCFHWRNDSDTENNRQTSEIDPKSNASVSDEMSICNNATIVFEANFCEDGIMDAIELIDTKTTNKKMI